MTGFSYQTLLPEHAEVWRELRLEGTRDFPLGFLVTYDEAKSMSLDRCREVLGHKGLRGVFKDQMLVGFCGYRPQHLERIKHRAEIGPFFVTQAYQGSGAAKAMMLGVISEAKNAGIAQLELFVDSENPRAMAFYESHGFKRIATHYDSVRVDGQPRHDHFMTLQLCD